MRINIETKFNIGDTVYVTDYYNDTYHASKRRCIINYIDVHVVPNLVVIYSVTYKDWGTTSEYVEHMLFATYEECQKWCDERNC